MMLLSTPLESSFSMSPSLSDLALASIPIAVAANGFRIVGTGLLVQYWDPGKAEGFFHTFSGWLIFVVSLLMLFALHRCLKYFLERNEGAA